MIENNETGQEGMTTVTTKRTIDRESLHREIDNVLDDLIATLQGDEPAEQAVLFDVIAKAQIQGEKKVLNLLQYSLIPVRLTQADENGPKWSLSISLDADI